MANPLASSSNSSGNKAPYQVFINHRGPDTKLSIAAHLHNRLHDLGLQVFLDKEEMEKGDFFTSQIAAAIRDASVHITIFSPRYAESEWCLNELLLMLESMQSSRSTIIPIFCGVSPADLRWTLGKDGVYAKALAELEQKKTTDSQTHQRKPHYDPDIIEKWRNALSNVSNIDGFDLEGGYNCVEWQLVNEVVQLVLAKVKKPPLDVSRYPTGLDQKVRDFEELLKQQQIGVTRVIGIVGLGGIGKTTLAKEIFNCERSNYTQSCFLFDIREKSLTTLQSDLIKDLTQLNVQIRSTDEGKGNLKRNLSSKQALIILDNVDHSSQLDALLLPAKDALQPSSLIIVTSRDKQLLINNDINESAIYKLECLKQQHSQELFCLHAFGQPRPVEEFEVLVSKFVGACCGLPLSLTVIGAHLRGSSDLTLWRAQLRKISKMLPDDIQSRLKISYDSLDDDEKQIFLDIACFFLGEDRDTAIQIWKGLDLDGWLGLCNLQNKCLIEVDSENNIIMHDHLRDLGRDIGEKNSPYRFCRVTQNMLELMLN
eukprot:PITA_25787